MIYSKEMQTEFIEKNMLTRIFNYYTGWLMLSKYIENIK